MKEFNKIKGDKKFCLKYERQLTEATARYFKEMIGLYKMYKAEQENDQSK